MRYIQCEPSPWFLYSVAINLGSSPGLLGQKLSAVAAHKPGELPKLISTEYRNQGSSCTTARTFREVRCEFEEISISISQSRLRMSVSPSTKKLTGHGVWPTSRTEFRVGREKAIMDRRVDGKHGSKWDAPFDSGGIFVGSVQWFRWQFHMKLGIFVF